MYNNEHVAVVPTEPETTSACFPVRYMNTRFPLILHQQTYFSLSNFAANCIDIGKIIPVQEIRVLQFIIQLVRVKLQHQSMMGEFKHTEATCIAMLSHCENIKTDPGFCPNKDGWIYFIFKVICTVINATPETPPTSSELGNTADTLQTCYCRHG